MANTFLQRNFTNAPTSQTTMTYSFWVKKSALATGNSNKGIFGHLEIGNAGNSNLQVGWTGNNDFQIGYYSNNGSDTHIDYVTNAQFKDNNGWYHVCIEINTTLATADDRVKLYINGVLVTSYSTRSNPPQNRTINTGNMYMYIGQYRQTGGTEIYLDGLLSEFIHSDGYAYSASTFGETDTDTGEWRIKDNPTFTPGNQGFKILSNGSTITDQSAGSNDFTVAGGTLTNTKDCPSNVFATMNSLANTVAPVGLTQGNNTVSMTNSKGGILSTLACTGGKYYAEMKIATAPQDFRFHWGILPKPISAADDPINGTNAGIMLSGFNAAIYAGGGSINAFYGGVGRFSGNPILGLAIDLESATNTIAVSVNGAWITGDNTTDASFSNALKVDITSYVAAYDDWFIGCGSGNSSGTTGVYNINFGNGTFGTSAVTSAGTAGSTPGTFEYDVPSGYEPLTTKGLNA